MKREGERKSHLIFEGGRERKKCVFLFFQMILILPFCARFCFLFLMFFLVLRGFLCYKESRKDLI